MKQAHPLHAGLSLVLVVMYGLRPFLVAGQKHAPSPLVGPQKVGGIVTIAAGWTSVFLGCVVIHQTWVRAMHAHFSTSSVMRVMRWGPVQSCTTWTTWRPSGMSTSQGTADSWELCRLVCIWHSVSVPLAWHVTPYCDSKGFIHCLHYGHITAVHLCCSKLRERDHAERAYGSQSQWTTTCIERCQKQYHRWRQ